MKYCLIRTNCTTHPYVYYVIPNPLVGVARHTDRYIDMVKVLQVTPRYSDRSIQPSDTILIESDTPITLDFVQTNYPELLL